MKKALFITVLIFVLLFSFTGVRAEQIYYNDEYHYYDAGEIGLKVNGVEVGNLPMYPVIINDYTMVPVREVFEAMGSQVIWHDDTCSVELKYDETSVSVKIGDRNTVIDGVIMPIEESQPLPMLIGKDPGELKTMVPVRFVAERLGFKVDWDDETRTVSITSKDNETPEKPEVNEDEGEKPSDKEKLLFGKVTAKSDKKYDYVYISAKELVSPKISRYTSPERIVLDFPNVEFSSRSGGVNLGGNSVESVRYSNHEDFARLVLDINDETQVFVLSDDNGIVIRTEISPNEKLIYDAISGRVYFDKNYAGKGKKKDRGYSVTFSNLKLSDQEIEIKDKNISGIIISNSATGSTVSVESDNNITYTAEKGFHKTDSPVGNEKPSINISGTPLVIIDPGHGGEDPGAVSYGADGNIVAYESRINLAISLLVGKKLENSGVEVVYTREKDKYITLQERSDLANSIECDLFVSIHCNSIENPEIEGTQVYYHPTSETGTFLAKNIYKKMLENTPLSPKETQNGEHLFVIRTTASPAVLVETAFISNISDRNYLLSSQGQEKIAESIYQGIMITINNK